MLLFHVALFKNIRTPSRPLPRTKRYSSSQKKNTSFLFSITGVLVYKIRFPLLRAAGNTGFSSTRLCLSGVGCSPCSVILPVRADTARLRPHLTAVHLSVCLYHSPSPAPALPQPSSGFQGRLEKPRGPAGSWEDEVGTTVASCTCPPAPPPLSAPMAPSHT